MSGTLKYSEVTAFMEKRQISMSMYKSITAWNKTISLTENHLIYARKKSMDKFIPM